MRNQVLFLFLLIHSLSASAQLFKIPSYPQNEFRNPLDIPIQLAANFGELRSNHYHMGLDIRTEHRENLPVYAVADGYIYRIKIEPFGFGQAIYIRHTNGFVSLYAHLNGFYPALASYIKQKQYELERWDVSLELPAGLLNVKKGDLVAYSGNMGGSQGPHLHFEIRTWPDDTNLNPLLFGFPVSDRVPPVFRSLSVYDRNKSFYEQRPFFVKIKKSGTRYTIDRPVLIVKTPNPGFGIQGFDTQSGSSNPNGIYQGELYDNGMPLSGFQMNRISYDDTRGINAHIDYPTHQRGGPYYQLLFKLPGYDHSIYKESLPGGRLHLDDGKTHEVRILLKDAEGNTSPLVFPVRYEPEAAPQTNYPGKVFYPGMLDGLENANAAFYLGADCLYDSLHLNFQDIIADGSELLSNRFRIGSPEVPLADTLTVRIKLNRLTGEKDRILMECNSGGEFEDKKPAWLGDWATATFKNFGDFYLVLDTLPPVIRFPGIVENANLQRSSRIAIQVTDNYKELRNFRAVLDGKWLLFSHDKARAYIYNFDEHCPPGKHELKIYVEDIVGNAAGAVLHFQR